MKKIISALTLGAMVCGAVFADVSLNLNYRQRANLYTSYEHGNKYTLFNNAYSGAGTDNLALSMSGDIVSFDVTLVGDQATTSKIRAKTLGASVFLGNWTVFGGFWADGKLNGAYRTKSDIDAGNLEGMDFEFKKLGSAFAASPAFFADNMVMPVNTKGESYALGATYAVPNIDNGALKVNAVYITNEISDEKAPTQSGMLQGHTGVLLLDGRLDGIGQGEVVFKYGQSGLKDKKGTGTAGATAMVFGAYVQPTIAKNLILTVGGAGSVVDGDFTDYSVDLRARYQVIPKKLSITSFHSYSALVDGKESAVSNKATKGIADAAAATDGKLGGTPITRDQIMSNNLMVRYNVNDKLSVFGIVADMIGMGDNMGKKVDDKGNKYDDIQVQLRMSGWAQFFASNSATVTAGVVCAIDNVNEGNDKDSYTTWGIPVVLRVKM
jgi:hypothetical protein